MLVNVCIDEPGPSRAAPGASELSGDQIQDMAGLWLYDCYYFILFFLQSWLYVFVFVFGACCSAFILLVFNVCVSIKNADACGSLK